MNSHHAAIAANRFGLGARPGDLGEAAQDPRGWLLRQLRGSYVAPAGAPGSAEALSLLGEFFAQRREARRAVERGSASVESARQAFRAMGREARPMYRDQVVARSRLGVETDAPFRERLTRFWSNHFAVSADKPGMMPLAATLEAEAVRPYVTGRFTDLLLAVTRHPAMLVYLDNVRSMGPGSRAARFLERRGRSPGLNENLAREILELHTLGVDAGYGQDDVEELARALTGWSVAGIGPGADRDRGATGFVFRPVMHEPGARRLLGQRYGEAGEGQAKAMLADLARRRETAEHLARKLARHFIADDPPSATVDDLAARYMDSDGHLPTVYEGLVEAPGAWEAAPAKFKTPDELVVSTFRALDRMPPEPAQLVHSLRMLAQLPFMPGSPAGWPDREPAWAGGAALLARVEWAAAVGERVGGGVDPGRVLDDAVGPSAGDHTVTAVRRAASPAQGLTLVLSSPEFQWR